MSYNPDLFLLQRKQAGVWYDIVNATFTRSVDYQTVTHNPGDEFADPPSVIPTLVVGSETATATYWRWGDSAEELDATVKAGDEIRCTYDGHLRMLGVVEKVTVTKTRDPEATRRGFDCRIDVSIEIGGLYAHLLGRTVCWGPGTAIPLGLAEETWMQRLAHWLAVT